MAEWIDRLHMTTYVTLCRQLCDYARLHTLDGRTTRVFVAVAVLHCPNSALAPRQDLSKGVYLPTTQSKRSQTFVFEFMGCAYHLFLGMVIIYFENICLLNQWRGYENKVCCELVVNLQVTTNTTYTLYKGKLSHKWLGSWGCTGMSHGWGRPQQARLEYHLSPGKWRYTRTLCDIIRLRKFKTVYPIWNTLHLQRKQDVAVPKKYYNFLIGKGWWIKAPATRLSGKYERV